MAITKVSQSVIEDGSITSSKLSGITTAHIGEGSNLYHTTARARGSISVGGSDLTYNSSTGVITGARPSLAQVLGQGSSTGSANISFPDNGTLYFGAGSDMRLYHDGLNSYIEDSGTGGLKIRVSQFQVLKYGTAEQMLSATQDGAVTLFHDNSSKLATTSTGISVTGGITVSDINTGQGATEVYMMNQNVRTTDDVTFDDLTITGNLTVNGTTTTASSADLDVVDKTITVGSGQTAANSGGSGIVVDGSNASILWDQANTEWDFNNDVNVSGTIQTTVGLKMATHPVIGYASFDGGYATRLGSTGTSTLNATQIYAGGSVQATFKGGKLGIGTTNAPSAKLHISGNSDVSDEDCMLIIDDVDGSAGSRIPAIMFRSNTGGTVTNQGRIRGTGHEGMVLSGSSALGDDLVVQASGVGIGTATPVNSANYRTLDIRATNGGQILLGRGSQFDFFAFSSSSSTSIGTAVGQDLIIRTNSNGGNNERMRITSAGNVGVATTNPNKPLTVTSDSGANCIGLRARSADDYSFIQFFNNAGSALRGQIYSHSSGDIGFTTGTDSSAGNDLYIKNGTGVGIGTSNPGVELDILRTTNATPLRIGSSGGQGRAMVFADVASTPSKYNWIAGAQYNVDNAFEITPSSAVGGYTFNDPSMIFKQDGQVLINKTGSDVGASTNIMEIDGSVRISGGNHSIKLNNGTIEVHAARTSGSTMLMLNDKIQLNTSTNLVYFPVNNNAYNFKVNAGSSNSWFGVYDDANDSANIIVTRSNTTESFKHLGHTGETTIKATGTGLRVESTNNEAIQIVGNSGGLNFTTGVNQRIFFGNQRALEGNSSNNVLQIGEGFSSTLYQTASHSFYGSIVPNASNSYDLGTSTAVWRDLYIGDLVLSNEERINDDGSKGNDIDGTTGNWRIQEGDEHLYIINNKNGKKYKFVLEELE